MDSIGSKFSLRKRSMKRVTIVVPVYHNARSLKELWLRFCTVAEENPESFEFVFVDDGSRDDSFDVLQELMRQDPRVQIVKLARNFGSAAACWAGIKRARGDAVAVISADLQDPPELISPMLAKWREGFRIVLAARASRQDGWFVSATSNLFWKLFRRFALPSMPKGGSDFCLVDRQVLDSLDESHEYSAGLGMILWTGFEPAVVYYNRGKREVHHGRSMWTFSKKITYLIDLFVSFSHWPIRCASMLGISLGLLGFVLACAVVFSKLFRGTEIQEGWASLMAIILIVSGAQLLMTGVLGEYLVRALDASRRRPPYIIDRVCQAQALDDAGGTAGRSLEPQEDPATGTRR